MIDKNQFQKGATARVRATGAVVELMGGPSREGPGKFFVESARDINIPASWARDLGTSQMSVYRLEDLDLIE